MEINTYVKSHGLGNDYIVLDGSKIDFELTKNAIIRICNIHFGIGSDGILLNVPSSKADFGLKIFNPDGSEAEKSGNGLRIFCKFLYDYGYTKEKQFTVDTLGGLVKATIVEEKYGKAQIITVDMGKAIFESKNIPVNYNNKECIGETLKIGDVKYEINCVSVGNPHCVVIKDTLSIEEIKKVGSSIETNSMFPNRINVQFAKVIDRNTAEVLIWERGAGYTLASGSSSCAVGCVLKKRGLVDEDITIKMQGGDLKLHIDTEWNIRMTGQVREIAQGVLGPELIEDLNLGLVSD
jgi:diaminopimelate epimerase